jgi:hypothetical protein
MAQPRGYLVVTSEAGVEREADTVHCVHCTAVVPVGPGASLHASGWCGRCADVVCARCAAAGRCVPFEAAFARQEARARLLRQVGV